MRPPLRCSRRSASIRTSRLHAQPGRRSLSAGFPSGHLDLSNGRPAQISSLLITSVQAGDTAALPRNRLADEVIHMQQAHFSVSRSCSAPGLGPSESSLARTKWLARGSTHRLDV